VIDDENRDDLTGLDTRPPGTMTAVEGATTTYLQAASPLEQEPRRSVLARLSARRWFRRLVVWGALAGIYEVCAYWAGKFFLPTIQAIVGGGYALANDGSLGDLWSALIHLVIGFALAIVVGVPVGVLMGSSKIVDYVVGMYVKALFVTSLVAVLPLLIILFGFGLTFRVSVVFLFSVFFIILNTAAGVRNVDNNLQAMGRAFGASRLKRTVAISVPSSLPFIIAGIRLGLANAFSGMILAELWVTRGLGLTLNNLGLNRDLPKFFALVLIVTLIAAFSAAVLKMLERRLMPWGAAATQRR
jgi:ABC-type nitrate/sulfonate/bicarbonate transport system permease component